MYSQGSIISVAEKIKLPTNKITINKITKTICSSWLFGILVFAHIYYLVYEYPIRYIQYLIIQLVFAYIWILRDGISEKRRILINDGTMATPK